MSGKQYSPKARPDIINKTIRSHFQDYSENTTIHGIKYIGDKRKSIAERITWIVIFLVSLAACSWMIYAQWQKWQQSPVIVSFADSMTPIYDIPFPAITICSDTKSSRKIFNYTKAHGHVSNLTADEKKMFEAVAHTCDVGHFNYEGGHIADDKVLDTLRKVSVQAEEFIYSFSFGGSELDIGTVFKRLLTSEGYCYTYNFFSRSGLHEEKTYNVSNDRSSEPVQSLWSLENGYDANAGIDAYPKRGLGGTYTIQIHGVQGGGDSVCTGASQGYKIMLHNPTEMPSVKRDYIRASLGQEMTITVKPSSISTSEGLRRYSPEKRKCYFASERQLRHFHVYTQKNCLLECLLNNTVRICQCTPFYMPSVSGVPVCRYGTPKLCAYLVGEMITTKQVPRGLNYYLNLSNVHNEDCNCLPGCFDLQYDMETTQGDYDLMKFLKDLVGDQPDVVNLFKNGFQLSEIKIFFKDLQFIARHRSELYGYADFMANCGGLLGLFMGFSVLSLVEIVYYCTIRVGSSFFQGRWGSRVRESDGQEKNTLQMTSSHAVVAIDDVLKEDGVNECLIIRQSKYDQSNV